MTSQPRRDPTRRPLELLRGTSASSSASASTSASTSASAAVSSLASARRAMTASTPSPPLRHVAARALAQIATADATDDASVEPRDAGPAASGDGLRTFAAIVCSECLYLEFPGCDLHGVLYSERAPPELASVPVSSSSSSSSTTASASAATTTSAATMTAPGSRTDSASPPTSDAAAAGSSSASEAPSAASVHAKCPKCTAATSNSRPFREGCRRCKAPTTVFMWTTTEREVQQAHDAFPPHCDELEHTTLVCDVCQSVVFPRAREALTRRTREHAMLSSNGKSLKVSNFQLSMPHVEGCPRKGMPLTPVAVQLTKSEMKFVLERIDQCPVTGRIQGGPQYRKRHVEPVTQQNHLNQIYLRMLSAIVRAFPPTAPNVLEPLRKMLVTFDRMEPLALFSDWSPPRSLVSAAVRPSRVDASSTLDSHHAAECVLTPGDESWSPLFSPEETETWLTLHFNPPTAISAVELDWHAASGVPRFALTATMEDHQAETVAIVLTARHQQRVTFAQREGVTALRLTVLPPDGRTSAVASPRFALQRVACWEAGFEGLHTPNEKLLRELHSWLLAASLSRESEVRDTATLALQRLALASGSLCGLVQLATALVLNVSPAAQCDRPDDEQDWHRLDVMSESMRCASVRFLSDLARQALQLMVDKDRARPGENSLIDKHVLEYISEVLAQSVTTDGSVNNASTMPTSTPPTKPMSSCADRPLHPVVSIAVLTSDLQSSIKRRSQLGLLLVLLLSELSAWQMKRMQKAEEYAGLQVPVHLDTEHVLLNHFAPCIQQAGFSSWQVVAGAQEISINLQRHLHWNRIEKMSHDSGASWIRVYPRDVAEYDDVLSDIEDFLAAHDERSAPSKTEVDLP
ncbi:hypothetical protein P43SY_003099 [Pythium insidiosum]|uniref:Uncharacterized protein n=1 Tax=Pythium insidiosum TaxID=114742 RepID=A0AAD5MHU0_PYTIN|nr:hypothetical protein P43SY_003099 [Pythium insidiosum]